MSDFNDRFTLYERKQLLLKRAMKLRWPSCEMVAAGGIGGYRRVVSESRDEHVGKLEKMLTEIEQKRKEKR